METFNKLKCTPCSGKTPKLSQKDVISNLSKINNWSTNNLNEMIYKKFKFKNFQQSIDFVNKISVISENENHHPDITFGWGYCLIMIHTHAIKGLSLNDFILASKIDRINSK